MRWSKPLSVLVAVGIALGALGSVAGLAGTTLSSDLAVQSGVVVGVVVLGMLAVVAVGVGYSRFLDSAHYW
jgi:hypothetical protein